MAQLPVLEAPLVERLYWRLFIGLGGERVARAVCQRIDERVLEEDPPHYRSERGVLLLRRRRYGDIPHLHRHPWRLPCGTQLVPASTVFELDLGSAAAKQALGGGMSWRSLIVTEFQSFIALFKEGLESAIIARTTLYRQLAWLGFVHRDTPNSLHRLGDSILRQFYLLAFTERGPTYVGTKRMDLVKEAAVSRLRLLERLEHLH